MSYTEYKCPDCLLDKRMIALDLETTGLDIIRNMIIEIGLIQVNEGKIVREYTTQFGGGHSSMYLVRNVHHIKDRERLNKKTFKERAKKMAEYLSNSLLITHNGEKFDIPMLNQKFSQVDVKMQNIKSIDTYQIVKKMKCFESNSLQSLSKLFNINYGGHRGLGDSYSTLQLLYALINKYGNAILS